MEPYLRAAPDYPGAYLGLRPQSFELLGKNGPRLYTCRRWSGPRWTWAGDWAPPALAATLHPAAPRARLGNGVEVLPFSEDFV